MNCYHVASSKKNQNIAKKARITEAEKHISKYVMRIIAPYFPSLWVRLQSVNLKIPSFSGQSYKALYNRNLPL